MHVFRGVLVIFNFNSDRRHDLLASWQYYVTLVAPMLHLWLPHLQKESVVAQWLAHLPLVLEVICRDDTR